MVRPKVFVTQRIFPEALEWLKQEAEVEGGQAEAPLSKEEILKAVEDKDGLLTLLVNQIDREIIERAKRLKIIANCAVGYDNIDVDFCRQRGIFVTNTPGVLTEATADLTWALILAVARKIPQADLFTRAGRFRGWALDLFLGQEVYGQTLGIIGFGRIGQAVARRALGFSMKIFYYDLKRLSAEEERNLQATYLPLDELLKRSDIITIHTSLNPSTYHLINQERISLMKKTAILINVARGPIVDEAALASALKDGKIWGAGLDVYEREPEIENKLLSLENVVLLPHIGSATRTTRLQMAMTAVRNLLQGLSGQRPDNLVW
ncbi:MAG: D-glycerate dehydrogenase [Candidatus Aminicenantes bacterium]|nr:D-glycerate dehydrogenase [Candidatus Aminicenantes bacterium]